ncbi:MAG: T9SS type A sorting domain-containing protein [Bacteroidetes bacterium]|nr:T9SS type A sorting domain-containing protein [Bacteroidota bacterium]MCW5931896.1 T9SS type A sorting domain-containing protein [Bacteroidota bacterium]
MTFTDTSYSVINEIRTIPFRATEGNISDENGNLLMSSNGIFISDATGDTMQGGGGLNPNLFTDDWSDWGLPIPYGNIILPMPDDSNRYVLFHQTGNYNAISPLSSTEIYFSVIDISLNGGLGEVISKNNIALNGLFGWGMAACKHSNGRDWWIIALSDSATVAYKFLLTPDTIMFVNQQNLSIQGFSGFGGEPTFSPDGEKFAFACGNGDGITGYWSSRVQLFDFDRCDGSFVLDTVIDFSDGNVGVGTAFSPNSKYLYFSTTEHIYQINADTSDIGSTFQLVATNDTFYSPVFPFQTNFLFMYLAANGKIYITSGNGVLHLHEIDYPDSAGTACNVNLHNVFINNFNAKTVPNHPNYYLGRKIGSVCDSLTSLSPLNPPMGDLKIFPNPNNGNFKIMYLLPQNKAGKLEIFDINGRAVYSQNLPQWSTLQFISLPKLSNGIYAIKINSDNFSVTKKLIIHHE